MKSGSKTASGSFSRIWSMIRPYRLWILLSIVLAAGIVLLTLYIPIVIGDAIDEMIGAGKVIFPSIRADLWKIGMSAGSIALLQWCMQTIHNRVTYQVVRDFRNAAFQKLQRLPLSYLDRHPAGETVSRMITDVEQFADGLLMGLTQLFTGIFTLLGTLGFMLVLNWKISLVVLLMTPLSVLFARLMSKKIYHLFQKQSELRAEQTAFINETIANEKIVQAFFHEAETQAAFEEINSKLEKASLKATFFSSLINPSTRFIYAIVYATVGIVGAFSVLSGVITTGGLSCFLSYTNQYTKPFNEITSVMTELQNAIACANRLFALLDEPEEVPDAPDAVVLEQARGEVQFKDMSFSYVPERPLVEHLDLDVKAGQRIAIVGPTGCGKTTLINLLMRFYEVCDGEIRVDGVDLRKLTRHSLRQNFGMVLQETWLKQGTVRENIIMGKPDSTEEEMIAAAKAAHAHSFIKQLPQGYDTVLQEQGGSLSQGQKQLLCIARLMLSLPPMLILDEATSSIDTRTEAKIQSAFAKMMKGRTSFIVAHRLSTIQEADRILVMKGGRIVERGTHTELLEQNGFYAKLYYSQFDVPQ